MSQPYLDALDEADPFDDGEVEGTHDVADHHGYDLASTPLDKLFSNDAMGFDTAGAMYDG
jgi:hypothetical protein